MNIGIISNQTETNTETVWNILSKNIYLNKQSVNSYNKQLKEFAIHVYSNDLEYVKKQYMIVDDVSKQQDFYVIAASYCPDCKMIDCLIKLFEIETNTKNLFLTACRYNTIIDVVKYFVDKFKIDVNYEDRKNNYCNCLLSACHNNTNLEIIKYLIEDHGMDTNMIDLYGNNCLMMACSNNSNLGILKYIIEDQETDVHYINEIGDNCMILACSQNTNLEIIKYLFDYLKIDILCDDNIKIKYLKAACKYNENIEVSKYLFEKFDKESIRLLIKSYLINNGCASNLHNKSDIKLRYLICSAMYLSDYSRLNVIILHAINYFETLDILIFIKNNVNIFMINKYN